MASWVGSKGGSYSSAHVGRNNSRRWWLYLSFWLTDNINGGRCYVSRLKDGPKNPPASCTFLAPGRLLLPLSEPRGGGRILTCSLARRRTEAALVRFDSAAAAAAQVGRRATIRVCSLAESFKRPDVRRFACRVSSVSRNDTKYCHSDLLLKLIEQPEEPPSLCQEYINTTVTSSQM